MFRQGFTCPALLEYSSPTTPTGLSPTLARFSNLFGFLVTSRWPAPLSLATTRGISVDVFSSRY